MRIAATVGRPAITDMEACIHDGFVVFSGLRAGRRYFFHLSRSMALGWSQHGQTGSQMNLNTVLTKRTEVDLPSPAEQVAIAQALLTGRIRLA